MRQNGIIGEEDQDRSVLPWRLVAGIFLHFLVPVYVIAVGLDIVLEPGRLDVEVALHRALAASPWILGGYALVTLLAVMVAVLLDPLLRARARRRAVRDPLRQSRRAERLVRQGLHEGGGRLGPRSDAALARLRAARWDFADPGQQALARDLAQCARASAAALGSAGPGRREAIAEMAAATFERLADAQADLAVASASEDERQARIIAGYVETRYGPSDFSGSGL